MKMKKIILFALCAFILISIFGTICLATEPVTADVPMEETTEANDIFTRIWEFVTEYKGEVLSIVGDTGIITTVAYVLFKLASYKKTSNKDMEEVKKLAGTTVQNQSDIVGVVNKLIDSYNALAEEHEKLKATYEKYESEEADRSKAISVMTLELNALLEIISSAYVNSNLPQGTKDMVAVKYAKCLKALESDETLSAILKAAQSALTNT
jgi:hypothetical protein